MVIAPFLAASKLHVCLSIYVIIFEILKQGMETDFVCSFVGVGL